MPYRTMHEAKKAPVLLARQGVRPPYDSFAQIGLLAARLRKARMASPAA